MKLLEIRNRTGRELYVVGEIIPPHSTIRIDIPYTDSLARLEANGFISVREVIEAEVKETIVVEVPEPIKPKRQTRRNKNI